MIRTYLILFTLIFFSACKREEKESLKFSGIYFTNCRFNDDDDLDGSKSCLRFFPNGKGVSATTLCKTTPENMKNWFDLKSNNLNLDIGNYSLVGNRITFSINTENGSVNYIGLLKNKVMYLKWESSITGYKGREQYHFIEFTAKN